MESNDGDLSFLGTAEGATPQPNAGIGEDGFYIWLTQHYPSKAKGGEHLKNQAYQARKLLREMGGKYPTQNAFIKAAGKVASSGAPASTIRHKLEALERLAHYYGFVEVDFKRLKPNVTTHCEHYLTVDQMRQVIAGAGKSAIKQDKQRDITIVTILCKTGMREGECAELRIKDIDFTQKAILVAHGKGDKERRIPMDDQLARALELYLGTLNSNYTSKGENPLFRNRRGQPMSGDAIYELVVKIGTDPRLGKGIVPFEVWPHLLRHSFATEFVNRGGDPFALKAILGHSTLAQTLKYFHDNDKRKREQMEKCAPIF